MVLSRIAGRVRSLRQRGLWAAAKRVAQVLYRRVVPRRVAAPHPFDVEHGLDTGGLLYGKDILSGHANDAQNTAYFGSQPSVMQTGLNYWLDELRKTGESPDGFTFLDIGCGKGRAVMLASELPFQRVIGIELSADLVMLAHENLERWESRPHLCRDLSVVTADVLEYPLPDGPTLLYMYHPFEAELFGRWVESLRTALPARTAPLYLLYANPYYENLLQALPHAHRIWTGCIEFTPEEIAAHLFGGTSEQVSLYRLTPPAA